MFPSSGKSINDRTRTPPAQSSSEDHSGRNARDPTEAAGTGLEDDLAAFRIDQSPEVIDTTRSASPAPTYRTVESVRGGRSASPAPSYATIDPVISRSDEISTLFANQSSERIVGSQCEIEELIRQNAVVENMRYAFEHHPESFGTVRMLSVPIELNGCMGQAMVGSGANRTIVSATFAAASGINDLVDTSFGGVAHGTGSMKIYGQIPSIKVTVGHLVLATSVTVMSDDLSVDVLLGLNTLSQYQACIDIKQNALIFQGHKVTFLGEADENQYQKGVESRQTLQGAKTLKRTTNCDLLEQSPIRTSMLYIPIEINGWKYKAMVDSGSQATVISLPWATACGIARLIDKRYAGTARGLGTANILGRIHSVAVKTGKSYFYMSLVVMDPCPRVDMLLGLDFLRRFDACVDLRRGALLVQDQEVPFLEEQDVPLPLEDNSSLEGGKKDKEDDKSKIAPAATDHKQSSGDPTTPKSYTPVRPAPKPRKARSKDESAQPQPTSRWAPDLISRIVEMGFAHDQAIYALDMTNGDLELAISALI